MTRREIAVMIADLAKYTARLDMVGNINNNLSLTWEGAHNLAEEIRRIANQLLPLLDEPDIHRRATLPEETVTIELSNLIELIDQTDSILQESINVG